MSDQDFNDFTYLTPSFWYVDDETFDWLISELEKPPREIPALVELLKKRKRFEQVDDESSWNVRGKPKEN
jgi:hypothetical protein